MILLCADDYAMSPGVSAGIRDLASDRRLSATSAMTTSPHWCAEADALLASRPHMSIGLHLNLTEGQSLTSPPKVTRDGRFVGLSSLLMLTFGGRLNTQAIAGEIRAQLDAFEKRLGHPPDHVDGHQHCHVLPVVRQALLDECKRRYTPGNLLVRYPGITGRRLLDSGQTPTKSLFIRLLSSGLPSLVDRHGFDTNVSFSGFSDFRDSTAIREEVQWITDEWEQSTDLHMSMCHPASPAILSETLGVDHSATRVQEYKVIRDAAGLPDSLLHPVRDGGSGTIDWAALVSTGATDV